MSEFWQKYKDPRWQRVRLQVMERANFTCERCEATEKTLNVHHKIYRKNAAPWEYLLDELVCLCEDCHESWHGIKDRLNEAIAKMDDIDLLKLVGYAEGKLLFQSHELLPKVQLRSYYDADGMSDAVSYLPLGAEEVLQRRDEAGFIDGRTLSELYTTRKDRAK